jgi:hypothetical protein
LSPLSVSGSSQFPLWHFDVVSGRGDHSISLGRMQPFAIGSSRQQPTKSNQWIIFS